jgi:hypothetical protein
MTRKFVYTNDRITTISVDDYHSSVANAIGGGYVSIVDNNLYFYGESKHFGLPDLGKLKELLQVEVEYPLYLRSLFKSISNIYVVRGDNLDEVINDIEISEHKPTFTI